MASVKISQLPTTTLRDSNGEFPFSGGIPYQTWSGTLGSILGANLSTASLQGAPTAGITPGGLVSTVLTGTVLYPYGCFAGTGVNNPPYLLRPTDFNSSSNPQVYELVQVAPQALGAGAPSSSVFLRGDGTWTTPPGGGSTASGNSLVLQVTQANSFTLGQCVYDNNGTWTLSDNSSATTSYVAGVITTTGNPFTVTLDGYQNAILGLQYNTQYYLGTAGALTSTAPTAVTAFLVAVMKTGVAGDGVVSISAPASLALIPGSSVQTAYSVTSGTLGLQLVGDTASPGASMIYGTSPSSVLGWQPYGSAVTSSGLAASEVVVANGTSLLTGYPFFTASPAGVINVAGLTNTGRATMSSSAAFPGLNVGTVAGNPATTINGDIWYNSSASQLNAQIGGSLVTLGASSGMVNPMTAQGDMIYSSGGSTPARLPIGAVGNVLTVSGSIPSWQSGSGALLAATNVFTGSNNFTAYPVTINGSVTQLSALIPTVGAEFTVGPSYIVTTGTQPANEQAVYVGAPIFSQATGNVTDIQNVLLSGPAVVGGGQTATRAHSLVIIDPTTTTSASTGALVIANSLGSATGVGIGNGAIWTSGAITTTGKITSQLTNATPVAAALFGNLSSGAAATGAVQIANSGFSTSLIQTSSAFTGTVVVGSIPTGPAFYLNTPNTYPFYVATGGTMAAAFDSMQGATFAQKALVAGQGGIGYTLGAGSTSNQPTSRTGTVILNTVCGQITLFSTTTTAGQTTTFTLTNSSIGPYDTLALTTGGTSFTGVYFWSAAVAAAGGSAAISVYTPAAVSSGEAPILNYTIIKGSKT